MIVWLYSIFLDCLTCSNWLLCSRRSMVYKQSKRPVIDAPGDSKLCTPQIGLEELAACSIQWHWPAWFVSFGAPMDAVIQSYSVV